MHNLSREQWYCLLSITQESCTIQLHELCVIVVCSLPSIFLPIILSNLTKWFPMSWLAIFNLQPFPFICLCKRTLSRVNAFLWQFQASMCSSGMFQYPQIGGSQVRQWGYQWTIHKWNNQRNWLNHKIVQTVGGTGLYDNMMSALLLRGKKIEKWPSQFYFFLKKWLCPFNPLASRII